MTRCRSRLLSPELAGRTTWEEIRQAAEEFPHLRPCPRHLGKLGTWQWIDRAACETCRDGVRDRDEEES